jgi:hypothetical protein
MSKTAYFGVYAAAFEEAYVSDDWSMVEPFFTEDATYQINLDPPMGGVLRRGAHSPIGRSLRPRNEAADPPI